MPVSVDDLYRSAAESGDWNFALWTTLLFDESGSGEVAVPSSQFQRDDLLYKVQALARFAKGHTYAEEICEMLLTNILLYDLESGSNEIALNPEDFVWLIEKLDNDPKANPQLRLLLARKALWE